MFTINLETQTVKNNTITLIANGKPLNGFIIPDTIVTIELLETLYHRYNHSIPDGIRNRYDYFKALPYSKLKPIDLITSENRQTAKYNLEMTLLIGVLNGSFKWPDNNQWFWQSKTDPDFVILRKWVKPQIANKREVTIID